jgi:hypothetical protein
MKKPIEAELQLSLSNTYKIIEILTNYVKKKSQNDIRTTTKDGINKLYDYSRTKASKKS